jgi:hypothetical protein
VSFWKREVEVVLRRVSVLWRREVEVCQIEMCEIEVHEIEVRENEVVLMRVFFGAVRLKSS